MTVFMIIFVIGCYYKKYESENEVKNGREKTD